METEVRKKLFDLSDNKYKDFQCKLMPTVDPERVIGVRMPDLRKYAKELVKSGRAESFTDTLPHKYYEEYNLHGIIINSSKNFESAILRVERLLPHIDNWATCDLLDFKVFEHHKLELYEKILQWISSKHTYTVRFGIKMLMSHFLDSDFDRKHLLLVASIKSEEYYVNMARAWYFATALTKRYEDTLDFIKSDKLDRFTHNKSIQKAIESYCISDESKAVLKTLRRKEKKNA